jgi:hypothetical protein
MPRPPRAPFGSSGHCLFLLLFAACSFERAPSSLAARAPATASNAANPTANGCRGGNCATTTAPSTEPEGSARPGSPSEVPPAGDPPRPGASLACPALCDDGDACTRDFSEMSGGQCTGRCDHAAITSPQDGDQCCPLGASTSSDTDCLRLARCGNAVVDAGEECDGDERCSTTCQHLFDPALVHRYNFATHGKVVTDSVGSAHGIVVQGELENDGDLFLSGPPENTYAELPAGLISSLTSATLETWFTTLGDADGQRIFDFGNNQTNEGATGEGTSYWALTPSNIVDGTLLMLLNLSPAADGFTDDQMLQGPSALSMDTEYHVAVVFDGQASTVSMYVNGQPHVGPAPVNGTLSQLDDHHLWLGRSQFASYPYFNGRIHEFRIYDQALSAAAIAESFTKGPEPSRSAN